MLPQSWGPAWSWTQICQRLYEGHLDGRGQAPTTFTSLAGAGLPRICLLKQFIQVSRLTFQGSSQDCHFFFSTPVGLAFVFFKVTTLIQSVFILLFGKANSILLLDLAY